VCLPPQHGHSSPRVQVSWNWREPSAKASRTTCLQGRMDQRRTLPKWRAQFAYECKRMGPWLLAMHAMRCVYMADDLLAAACGQQRSQV
jgi:hypothetical protein